MFLVGKLPQHVGQVAVDVFGQSEHTPGLGQINAAQLARPRIDVLEDEMVKRLEVGKIVGSLDPDSGELCQP